MYCYGDQYIVMNTFTILYSYYSNYHSYYIITLVTNTCSVSYFIVCVCVCARVCVYVCMCVYVCVCVCPCLCNACVCMPGRMYCRRPNIWYSITPYPFKLVCVHTCMCTCMCGDCEKKTLCFVRQWGQFGKACFFHRAQNNGLSYHRSFSDPFWYMTDQI